jgi:hypothetical protein
MGSLPKGAIFWVVKPMTQTETGLPAVSLADSQAGLW